MNDVTVPRIWVESSSDASGFETRSILCSGTVGYERGICIGFATGREAIECLRQVNDALSLYRMMLEGKIGRPKLTDYERRCVEESRGDGCFIDLVAIIDRLTKETS